MRRLARGFLIAVSVLNGLSGLACGVLFIVSPDGSIIQAEALLPVIGRLPFADVFFRDFSWIGIAMLLVLGVPNTTAAFSLIHRRQWQYRAALMAALLLIAWTGFELIFMYNGLALAYFVVGVLCVACTIPQPRRTPGEGATIAIPSAGARCSLSDEGVKEGL